MKPALITQETQVSGNPGYLLRNPQQVELDDPQQAAIELVPKIQGNFEELRA